jgi:DNA helicase-2/ATP-dependent DNA helicase PcrA
MIYATGRLLYGGLQHNPPSRFLSEIDAEFASNATESAYGYDAGSTYPSGNDRWTPSSGFSGNDAVDDEPRYVPDIPELSEGDRVRHQTFGTGTVMEIDGETAVIYFKGKGARKLNISFAPLEKI